MHKHVGTYIRRQREAQGLSRGDVGRAMGRTNVSKAARRLVDLEGGQGCLKDYWNALRAVLSFDEADLARAVQRDREDYERWLDEPVEMVLIVSYGRHSFLKIAHQLPDDVVNDPAKAEEFACQVAREKRRKVCLIVSRRESVWINDRGQATVRSGPETTPPAMSVGGKRFLLQIG